ncbi:MAG: helix-turn-helix domain-containing protein [Gammaproteobacteria bacterium]|nr:helix-turn-helix domain-containing protein [Gammaproteobacteria bacterium]MBU1716516.1 helix-turn-helix domain-containing protein [Pseudomonadota bacterium]
MRKRHSNYRLVKIHHNYTVEEVSRLLSIHKRTVRAWIKSGLPVLNEKRPMLILGHVLKEFLKNRWTKNKRPCKPGQFYCFRCRAPKYPAGNMAEYHEVTDKFGNLVANCSDCGTIINQRISLQNIERIRGKINVSFPEALRQLNESVKPSVNSHFRKETKNHGKAQSSKRKNQATIFDFLEGSQRSK